MTVKDIIRACSGKDELGYNKAAVGLFFEKIDIDGNSVTISEVNVDKPIVNIFKSMDRVQVDIIYSIKNDVDFIMMNKLLLRATDAENSVDEDTTEFPIITLSIVPHEYDGQFYVLCADPVVWCLTAQDPRGDIDTLRFVFDEDDFNILATSEKAYELMNREIEDDIRKEEEEKKFYEQKDAERKKKIQINKEEEKKK